MKILLSSPYQRKLQGQYFYIKALKSLGHQVEVFWYNQAFSRNIQPTNKVGIKVVRVLNNERLKKLTDQFKPDILLQNTGADIIYASTISYIKSTGCKTTLFSGDSPKSLLNTQYEKKYLKYFDAIFVADNRHKKEWEDIGAKKVINLPIFGIDPGFHKYTKLKKSEKDKLTSDVCFVGSLFQDRQEKLIKIIKNLSPNADLKIWGYIYKDMPLKKELKPFYQGIAWEKKFIKIFSNTKIAINFLPLHMGTGGNMRTFEIPACKTVQLVDKIDPTWYTKDEVVKFNTPKEAADQINLLLKDEPKRKSIATRGHARTIKDHTYKSRFASYIKFVKKL